MNESFILTISFTDAQDPVTLELPQKYNLNYKLIEQPIHFYSKTYTSVFNLGYYSKDVDLITKSELFNAYSNLMTTDKKDKIEKITLYYQAGESLIYVFDSSLFNLSCGNISYSDNLYSEKEPFCGLTFYLGEIGDYDYNKEWVL